jgi:hypothetical protein
MGILRLMVNIKGVIEGAVVMTESNVGEFVSKRNQRFRWERFLPKRKAWIQTLVLLPFGLPVGNFLGASWNFSVNAIGEEQQYLIGILAMAVNLLLPSLFFSFLFHWGWFVWKKTDSPWYPQAPALWAGTYATLTIAISFALVELVARSVGACGNPGWAAIGASLLCNLDGYGFESKSWFGAWFIIAAYGYRAQDSIELLAQRIFSPDRPQSLDPSLIEENHALAADDDFGGNPLDSIATHAED